MWLTKVKMAALVALVGLTVAGGAGWIYQTRAAEPGSVGTTPLGSAPLAPAGSGVTELKKAPPWTGEAILGVRVESYAKVFEQVLDVLDDQHFEIAYSDRYSGRIETHWRGKQPVRHRAVAVLSTADDGGFHFQIRVYKEAKSNKGWTASERDIELEKVILQRLQPAEKERAAQGSLWLRDVQLNTIDRNRTISIITLSGQPTTMIGLPVKQDARIVVKRGTDFSKLTVGMRLSLRLSVEDNQLVVAEIRQDQRATSRRAATR